MMCVITKGYIYAGRNYDIFSDRIILLDAYIIYDTGPWGDREWKLAEYLGAKWCVILEPGATYGEVDKALPGQATYPAGQAKTCTPAPIQAGAGGGRLEDGAANKLQNMMIAYRYAEELQAHSAYLKVKEFVESLIK